MGGSMECPPVGCSGSARLSLILGEKKLGFRHLRRIIFSQIYGQAKFKDNQAPGY